MKKKGWGHVMFHGGVPSGKRKDLVDRFRDDKDCRLFLSTDAGGVGLNLQFASVVMNMDLPWNPAVLEQRIGRVHRLGQKQPVRVVNFVAQGTIEEGMLSVISFKKSLFAGVLDGGAPNIDFGGSKLKKFMESVESVTSPPRTAGLQRSRRRHERIQRQPFRTEAAGRSGNRRRKSPACRSVVRPTPDGHGVIATNVVAARRQKRSDGKNARSTRRENGRKLSRLPIPDPAIVDQALSALGKLLEGLRR